MQRVLGSLVIGMLSVAFGETAIAETGSASASAEVPPTADAAPEGQSAGNEGSNPASADQSQTPDAQCSPVLLERYANRRAFTLRLIEQRERQRFESDVSSYESRRAFTEQLLRQRAQLPEGDWKRFDEQVAQYARLREFTLRLEDERDMREALEFARDLALLEKKKALTRALVESRRATVTTDSDPSRSPSLQSDPAPQPLP